MPERNIIHIDMDAFFASVEQRDNPEFRGKPVVVGGDPSGRGVVAAASYEARTFGIRSAMPSATARRLCPKVIFLKPDFKKYHAVSEMVFSILRQHTELVEPVSLDEAYLDVTRHRFGIKDAAVIASLLKQNIFAVTRLTASAGVAPNMFLAKIASELKKPDGLTVIRPNEVKNFLRELSVRKIPGVGPVTEKELDEIGIRTCADILKTNKTLFLKKFGKWGTALYERAEGRDDREVQPHWESKQISTEQTFLRDTKNVESLKEKLREFSAEIFGYLKEGGRAARTVTLKVKYFDFELITRSRTLPRAVSSPEEIYHVVSELLENKTRAGEKPVRLLGVGVSGFGGAEAKNTVLQPDLFLK